MAYVVFNLPTERYLNFNIPSETKMATSVCERVREREQKEIF